MGMKILKYVFSVKEEKRTRGHGVKLANKPCILDIRKLSIHKEQ